LEPNTNKFTKTAIVYKGASNYKLQSKLGEGAVGEVFRVVHKQTQELYALKRVSKISATMVSDLFYCVSHFKFLFKMDSTILLKIFGELSKYLPFLPLIRKNK
jgi:serine/threonine protein kinase|tara:strand:- start:178 stop:486 length:309 start_codon:yes stop_codon:yes gene_type:complete